MLTSEFNQELGALIRRLEAQIRTNPGLRHDDDPLTRIEQAIVTLCAMHIALSQQRED